MVCKFEAGKQLKSVYGRIFYLLDQMLMLFSYEIWKKKFPINFSSLYLRDIKASNFSSDWRKNHARRENEDSRAVTSIQERLVSQFLCSTVVSFWAFNINPIHIFVHSLLPPHTKNNREIMRPAFLYWHHSPSIPSLPSCKVLYPTGSEIWYRLSYASNAGEEKW